MASNRKLTPSSVQRIFENGRSMSLHCFLEMMKMASIRDENIGSVSLTTTEKLPARNSRLDKQWNLPRSNMSIQSMHVSKDNHVFLCSANNASIMEFTESGTFVCECKLFEGENTFTPLDMCSISPVTFMVACGYERKLIILERRTSSPFLQMKQTIGTVEHICSLCEIKSSIFTSDAYLQIETITKEGKERSIIKSGCECECYNRIRFDPSSGHFCLAELSSCEIIFCESNGLTLGSVKTVKISDFCVNEFGHLYICNPEGIFSFSTKKIIYKFEKRSESLPRMFILKNKIHVSLRLDGQYLIKILELFY